MAYFSSDIETGQSNLWLGQPDGKTNLLLTDVSPPLIPLEQGVAVYDQDTKTMQSVAANGQELSSIPASFDQLSLAKSAADNYTARQTEVQSDGDWVAVTLYNSNGVLLLNSKTGEEQLIELGGVEAAPFWALNAKWSPDGQKLALIVSQGPTPIDFSELYILDWPEARLREVDDTFHYVTDMTWASDSSKLLFKAVIDRNGGIDTNALFITDVSTDTEILPVPFPIDGLSSSFVGALSWSPDGKLILVKYADEAGSVIYKAEIDAPLTTPMSEDKK